VLRFLGEIQHYQVVFIDTTYNPFSAYMLQGSVENDVAKMDIHAYAAYWEPSSYNPFVPDFPEDLLPKHTKKSIKINKSLIYWSLVGITLD
jgi:hypothetical protein